MSSLNSILNIASSGILTAQTALGVTSDNVANVNTTGYVRKVVNQAAEVVGGQGQGVTVADITRVTNQYLEAASYVANAGSSSASAVSSTLDQAQSLFGDPSADGSLFSNLDSVFSAFSTLAATPSTAGEQQAVSQVSQFLNQATSIANSLNGLSSQADQQISQDVTTANQLLSQISSLNATISQNAVAGDDATGAQNQQSQLINQLSSLMDIKVNSNGQGGVSILASDGTSLVGPGGAASLAYDANGPTGTMSVTNTAGVTTAFDGRITSGEIGGLLQVRNVDLPATSSQLAALTSGVATELNAIHNSYSAVPPPTTLTGQTIGQDISTAAANFTGKTTIALVNTSTEAVDHTVAIDFDAKTITVDGGAAQSFTSSTFLSTLNSAMASAGGGSATYTNGALSLSSGSSTDGVAIQDDATTPASNGGQGFSAFFGLNNLVSSTSITNYATGLTATSPSGFPAGQSLTLRLSTASGAKIKDVTVTTPTGGTVADLMTALNSTTSGVGAYGSFSLDSDGELSFTPSGNSGATVSVVADSTANTTSGASVSQVFGIGAATRNQAATTYAVRSDIVSNPGNLATATLNLSAGAGEPALAPGDTSGSDALGQAGLGTLSFDAVVGAPAQTTTLSNYAASISSVIGNKAAAADTAKSTAATVASNAATQLSSTEGVSIDQELINLTTYQQAYNASARMVQAANDLYTVLLNMTGQ
jgi:flagellar hook-associated protein 1 FlgK